MDGEGRGSVDLNDPQYERGKLEIVKHSQALDAARANGNRLEAGRQLLNLGVAYLSHIGQPKLAIEHYEQALIIFREVNDPGEEANVLGRLGEAYMFLKDLKRAVEYYEQALVICRKLGD